MVFVGGGELLLRGLWPQPPRGFSARLFEQRENLRYLVPGAAGRHIQREFSVSVAGNRFGYRAGTWADTEGLARKYWLFGDSFVFGWGVEADQAASSLLTAAGRPSANFAMPGDGLRDYATRLEKALAAGERPLGVVVVMFDDDLPAVAESSPAKRELAATRLPAGFRLRQALLALHTVRLLARGVESLGVADLAARASGTEEARRRVHRRHCEPYRRGSHRAPQWVGFAAELGALAGKASAAARRPCVVVHLRGAITAGGEAGKAAVQDLGLRPADYDFEIVAAILERAVRDAGGVFATFAPATPAEARDWTFRHDSHLTAKGQAELARRIDLLLSRDDER